MSSRRFSNSAWSSVLEGLSDLKGSIHGANIILCSGGYRVSIHESLVRKFTRVFNNLPDDLAELKDENGFLVVILPDLNSQSLRALADFLYTGKAVFTPEDVRADLDQLLAPIIQVSGPHCAFLLGFYHLGWTKYRLPFYVSNFYGKTFEGLFFSLPDFLFL